MQYRIERTDGIRNEVWTDNYATAVLVANALARDLRGTGLGVLIVDTDTNKVRRSLIVKKGARKARTMQAFPTGVQLVAGE